LRSASFVLPSSFSSPMTPSWSMSTAALLLMYGFHGPMPSA